jgi:hypothetical protein
MELTLTPEIYTPSIDDNGVYIDRIHILPIIQTGIICPCGLRKDKIYDNVSKFTAHTKTKKHQGWLIELNRNKANYYVELLTSRKLIEHQQQIITRYENQLHTKSLTIDYLTEQLLCKDVKHSVIDLLDL